jgi:hypothetical protein
VCHHPPITAYQIEAKNYEVFSQQVTTSRFNGRNIIMQPQNRIYVKLRLPNGQWELYSSNQPQVTAHNLVIGKLYVEASGKC